MVPCGRDRVPRCGRVAASGNVLFAKGAPESILARCTFLRTIAGNNVRILPPL